MRIGLLSRPQNEITQNTQSVVLFCTNMYVYSFVDMSHSLQNRVEGDDVFSLATITNIRIADKWKRRLRVLPRPYQNSTLKFGTTSYTFYYYNLPA